MKHIFTIIVLLICQQALATVWEVGPTKSYKYCSEVEQLVQNGDTVTIDYATYKNDKQVTWRKDNLFITGVGGRPRLEAGSLIANDHSNGKGIFVLFGNNITIENIEFANAAVPDHNGAGIRQQSPRLIVRHCKFIGNEMGILSGGGENSRTLVEYCEFLNGGSVAHPGYQHNIYINHIDTLIFRYNFSYNAIASGHEFKSRANYNFILYNTIANYTTVDSRTIDIPNGGTAVIMGNIIEQGPNSENTNLLGYGLEGLINKAPHELWIVNNTFVNKKNKGSFVSIKAGTQKLTLENNILAGAKTGGLIIGKAETLDSSNNLITDVIADCGFRDADNYDYHLLSNSVAVDAGTSVTDIVGGYLLTPDKMYRDTCNYEDRTIENSIDIGAYEYNNPLSVNEFNQEATFLVYPNIVSQMITVNFPTLNKPQTLQFYNTSGILVKEISMERSGKVNVSDLANGLYLISLKNSTMQAHKIFVVH